MTIIKCIYYAPGAPATGAPAPAFSRLSLLKNFPSIPPVIAEKSVMTDFAL